MTLPIILRTDAELNMGASVIDRIREVGQLLERECCNAMLDLLNGRLPGNIKNVEFQERLWYDKYHSTP
jgi:hypothetical protein